MDEWTNFIEQELEGLQAARGSVNEKSFGVIWVYRELDDFASSWTTSLLVFWTLRVSSLPTAVPNEFRISKSRQCGVSERNLGVKADASINPAPTVSL